MATEDRRDWLISNIEKLPVEQDVKAIWQARLKSNQCPMCGKYATALNFRNERSRKEHEISHLCQQCQDDIFGG